MKRPTISAGGQLAGAVAIVTGGSSGIGAATVRRLAEAGAAIVIGYNKGEARAKALMAELPGSGHRALHLPMEDTARGPPPAAVLPAPSPQPALPATLLSSLPAPALPL